MAKNVVFMHFDVYFKTMPAPPRLDIVHKDEYFFSPPAQGMPWVMRVASEHWGPAFVQYREPMDNRFIGLIQQGACTLFYAEGGKETVTPGSVMYFSGHDSFHVQTEPEGAHLLVFTLQSEHAQDSLDLLPKRSGALPLQDPSRVESLIMRILDVGEKRGLHASAIASSLLAPTILTIDQEYRSHDQAPDAVHALFMRCRTNIEHHWRSLNSVNDVPEKMGISQPYMAKLFQRYEGCTPHQFLLKQKMTHALYALQQPEITIAQIANELGFGDAYSFSKSFKRVMGKSPKAMRG